MQSIAVIGTGIAGLTSAWLLRKKYKITVFEKNTYIGGHSNTISIDTKQGEIPVDTGFSIFNQANYPNTTALFNLLDITTTPINMSFSASINQGEIEYGISGINSLFSQRKNILNPNFLHMFLEVIRFNHVAKQALNNHEAEFLTLEEFLEYHRFKNYFKQYYLLPMAAAIWSCPVATLLSFPATSFIHFFNNHGLLNVFQKPKWLSIQSGSQNYVQKLCQDIGYENIYVNTPIKIIKRHAKKVDIYTKQDEKYQFDQVIMASHADEALALLDNPTYWERTLLSSFVYQKNMAILHKDDRAMPSNKNTWACWNYLVETQQYPKTSVTYWINKLQQINTQENIFITINPFITIQPEKILKTIYFRHPLHDLRAIRSQQVLHRIQGFERTWYCGSYFGNGFHEDALNSAIAVAQQLGSNPTWINNENFVIQKTLQQPQTLWSQ